MAREAPWRHRIVGRLLGAARSTFRPRDYRRQDLHARSEGLDSEIRIQATLVGMGSGLEGVLDG